MDIERVKLYFERIGLDLDPTKVKPDFELLKKLQYAHVTTVPYENLDILCGIPLKLDSESLFEKIVTMRRGGFCFELNCEFNWLLKELGYSTLNCFARFLRDQTEIPMRRHRVIIAWSDYTDGRVLCDVGVGSVAPRYPLKMKLGVEQEQFGEVYRFVKDAFYGWVIEEFHKDEWRKYFAFTEEEQLDIDYVMPSFYCETHPDSPFNKEYMLSIKTADGRMTIDGHTFRIFNGDSVDERYVEDESELENIMLDKFGLEIII